MNDFVVWLSQSVNLFPLWAVLLFVFVSACIQQVFPPYPSEVLLLLLGCLAAAHLLPGLPVIAAYALGTVLSSLLMFEFSRRAGKGLLGNPFVRRVFPRRYQRRAGVYVRRYGVAALVLCKFLPGVNSVCLIMGGVLGLHGPLALLAIGVTGVVANVLYFIAGSIIGRNIPALVAFSGRFSMVLAIAAGVIVLAAVGLILLQRQMRAQRRARRRAQNGC